MSQDVSKCPVSENELSEAQESAAAMLAVGKRQQDVAQALGIDRRTLFRWRRERAFKRALNAGRRELWSSASDRIRAMLGQSVDVLEQQLGDRYIPSRVRAATTILRLAGVGKSVPPPVNAKKKRGSSD